MISSASAFRSVLPVLTSKTSVMAMPRTTLKYCCRNAWNRLLPMPPASMLSHTRPICSDWHATPGKASTCFVNASREILSSPGRTSCKKYRSMVRSLESSSARMALETSGRLASTMAWHLARTASTERWAFFFRPSSFPDIRRSSRLARSIAPCCASAPLGKSATAACTMSLATVKCFESSSMSFSTSSFTESGVANASASSLARAAKVFVASSSFARQASTPSHLAAAGARITSACFRSLASMWAFASFFSFFASSALPSAILLFNFCNSEFAVVTRAFNFVSSEEAFFSTSSRPAALSSCILLENRVFVFCTNFNAASTVLLSSEMKPARGDWSSTNVVPELPCIVTKPVAPVSTTVHSMRSMSLASSFWPPWNVSRTSPPSSFATALPLATSKLSVSVISLTTVKRCLNMALNSSLEILPSASASICLNIASRRASLKAISSRCKASGNLSMRATKASFVMPSAPLATSAKRASWVSSLAFMWSRQACASVRMLAATRKRSPCSSISGTAASFAFFTSSSMAASFSSASAITFLATNFASYTAAIFFSLATDACASFMRLVSSFSVSLCASLPCASRCLALRNCFVCSIASCAALSWETSLSAASSDSSFSPSFVKGSAASFSFLTSSSTLVILTPASCIMAVFLRLSVSLRNVAMREAAALMRSVSLANSSPADLAAASPYCFTSKFFEAMSVRAAAIALCTAAAASSEAFVALVASCKGSTSMPLMKGSSASSTFSMPASTSLHFAVASRT
mmetsp:Transcript_40948/g.118569  ORF Transcript_40948/g.118569 Transcript_40948/m.118569 type:complete len:756 (-) Transcript_40948:1270-3537(-)